MKVSINIVAAGLALVSVAFTSCRKVELNPPVVPTDQTLAIITSIEGSGKGVGGGVSASASASASTKATDPSGTRSVFTLGDHIGLYVVPFKNTATAGVLEATGNYANNVDYSYINKSGNNVWDGATIFYPNMQSDIYGFAPYSANFTPGANAANCLVSIPADQSLRATLFASDIMTAKITAQAASATPLALKFFHRFSLVNLKFSVPAEMQGIKVRSVKSVRLEDFSLDAHIDYVAPYNNIINGSGAINPKPAVVAAGSAVGDITPHKTADGIIGNATTFYTYEAIVVPQSMAAGKGFVAIDLEFNNNAVTTYYYKVPDGTTQDFFAGSEQNIELTFTADSKLLIGAVTIDPWGTTAATGGEVIETVVFNDFTLNLAAPCATQIATVKLICDDGETYTLRATHNTADKFLTFAFDGSMVCPEYYPYTIKAVEFYDASAAKITTITDSYVKQLTAKGAAILRPGAWSANCYVVAPGGSVRINALRAGNDLADATQYSKDLVSSAKSVRILWQTAQGHALAGSAANMTLASVAFVDGVATVTATAGGTGGNAVIAAFDAVTGGNILWSWHIWVSPANEATMLRAAYGAKFTMANGLGCGIMDRNLGALSATKEASALLTGGMIYQWGRKDPFVGTFDGTQVIKVFTAAAAEKTDNVGWASGAAVINATNDKSFSFLINTADNVASAVKSPMTLYGSDVLYGNHWTHLNPKLWTSSEDCSSPLPTNNKGPKAIYDPCPAGYRVATGGIESYGTWGDLGPNNGKYGTVSGTGLTTGFTFGELIGSPWYPGIHRRGIKGVLINNPVVAAHSASVNTNYYATYLYGQPLNGVVDPVMTIETAWGQGVRCVQE